MTNNQSIKSSLVFADYQFRRTYDFIEGFELIGGISMDTIPC